MEPSLGPLPLPIADSPADSVMKLPSKDIQSPATSHNLQGPGPGLPAASAWITTQLPMVPRFCPGFSKQPSLHTAAKTILLQLKSVQVMRLLKILQWLSSHSGTKPAAFQRLRSPYLSCTSCSDLTSCYSALHQAMRYSGPPVLSVGSRPPLQASAPAVSPAQKTLSSALNVLGSLISFRP